MFVKQTVSYLVKTEKSKIGDIVKQFDRDQLKMLKAECGGMQTLLKNNKQLFVVEGNGLFSLFISRLYRIEIS